MQSRFFNRGTAGGGRRAFRGPQKNAGHPRRIAENEGDEASSAVAERRQSDMREDGLMASGRSFYLAWAPPSATGMNRKLSCFARRRQSTCSLVRARRTFESSQRVKGVRNADVAGLAGC